MNAAATNRTAQFTTVKKLVTYYRVSTDKQGESGLGLEAQKAAIEAYARAAGCEIVAEYIEIESGTDNDRPELAKALLHTKRTRNASLIVKSLCRLARKASKAITLVESTPVIVADSPNMGPLEMGIRAVIDQEEARRISERTKAALAALKARGVKLGTPENLTKEAQLKSAAKNKAKAVERTSDIAPIIMGMKAEGLSMSPIADRLNAQGITTPNGGQWHAAQVQRILKRQA